MSEGKKEKLLILSWDKRRNKSEYDKRLRELALLKYDSVYNPNLLGRNFRFKAELKTTRVNPGHLMTIRD